MPSPQKRGKYIPLPQRANFQDVVPLPNNDGDLPIVQISYEPLFKQVHEYFNALFAAKEYSARGLELSAEVIDCNPANYTAWWFRRKCLEALGVDLQEELDGFCEQWLVAQQKNYQVWYHRKWLVEKLDHPQAELALCEEMLESADDHKIWGFGVTWGAEWVVCFASQVESGYGAAISLLKWAGPKSQLGNIAKWTASLRVIAFWPPFVQGLKMRCSPCCKS